MPPGGEMRLVTVLAGDEGTIAIGRSMLEAFKIPFIVRGEDVQDLSGLGRLGTGFNTALGPAFIQVPEEHAAEAMRLLRDLREPRRRAGKRRYRRRDA